MGAYWRMVGFSFDSDTAFPAAIILVIVGITIALARWGKASVNGSSRAPEVYGYTVCLIAIITALISISGLLDAGFQITDPLANDSNTNWSEFGEGHSLRSLDAFKATTTSKTSAGQYVFRHRVFGSNGVGVITDTLSEADVRSRYETLRADKVAAERFKAIKGLVTNGIMFAIALALFVWHWRWMRRPGGEKP